MPSRASAARELLRRGLDAKGFAVRIVPAKSGDYGVRGPQWPDKNWKEPEVRPSAQAGVPSHCSFEVLR